MKMLMCPPEYYGIEYEINPWMKLENKANHERALLQWKKLYQTIVSCGAEVELIQPVRGCPDMTFTANAGLLYQQQMIISHFKYREREKEAPYFETWFKSAGFRIRNPVNEHPNTPFFEGAGDALSNGKVFFVGFGFRSDLTFYQSAPYLDQANLIYCQLVDPYFYHIDTCFCPLDASLGIWYPHAFAKASQIEMPKHMQLIEVAEDEAQRFACNAVVIDKYVILPSGCPKITADLKSRGYTVFACDMDEYLKAGGACKCLTLRIDA